MSSLSAGTHADVVLAPGEVLRVSTGGVTTVVSAYGAPAGTTTITSNTQDFGPYSVPAKLAVNSVSGSASYSNVAAYPVVRMPDGSLQAGGSAVESGGSVAVTVSGTPGVGNTLTAAFPMGVGTVKWQRLVSGTWTDISGATAMTYQMVSADAGNQLRPVSTSYAPYGLSVSVPAAATGYKIILLEGQSNECGRAEIDPALDTTDPRIFVFNGKPGLGNYQTITLASDPLTHPESGTKVGPGMSLAKAYLADNPTHKVLLVPTAVGGTNLSTYWNPDAVDGSNIGFLNMVSQFNLAYAAAGPGSECIAVHSIQGETDAEAGAVSGYEAKKRSLIAKIRALLGAANAVYVIGQMVPDFFSTKTNYRNIDAIHRNIAATTERCGFSAVGTGYAAADQVHYIGNAPRLMGAASNVSYKNALGRLASAAPGQASSIVLVPTTTTVAITHDYPVDGGPITDWQYQYKLAADSTWTNLTRAASTTPGATITGLTSGQNYNLRIGAVNANGTTYSTVQSFTAVAPTIPAAPTIGVASAGDGYISVAFTAGSNGGSPILDFTVTLSTGQTATGTASPISVAAPNGTAASATATQRNAVGSSAASGASNSVTPTAGASSTSKVRMASLTGAVAESGDATVGWSYKATVPAIFTTHHVGVSDKKLAAGVDGYIEATIDATQTNVILGIVTSAIDPVYSAGTATTGYKYGCFNLSTGGGFGMKQNGSGSTVAAQNTVTWVPGDKILLMRIAGTWSVYNRRAADPTNPVLIHTFPTVDNGDAWFAMSFNSTAGATAGLSNVTGFNLT